MLINYKICLTALVLFIILSCSNNERVIKKVDSNLLKNNSNVTNKTSITEKQLTQQQNNQAIAKQAVKLVVPEFDWKDELKAVDQVDEFKSFLKNVYSDQEELSTVISDKKFLINYDNINLSKFIKLVSTVLKFDYILNSSVKGTISINLQNDVKLTRKQLWLMLDYVLNINGAYISITDDKIVNILPINKFDNHKARDIYRKNSNIELSYFRLKYSSSGDAAKMIKSVFKEGISVVENSNKKDIIIISTNEISVKVAKFIAEFDNKFDSGWSQQILHCENLSPSILVKELAVIMQVLGFPIVTNYSENKGQQISLIALDRHKAILISSPNTETIDYIRKWLKQIDYKNTKATEQLFTYSVKYSSSAVLIQSINTFFNQATVAQQSGVNTGGVIGVANAAITNNAGGATAFDAASSGSGDEDNVFSDKIILYEDQRVNRIILKCRLRTFTVVKTLLDILDAPPLQALVRVTAVDIQLNDDLQYGFSYAANQLFGSDNKSIRSAVGSSIAAGALQVNATGVAPPTGLGVLFANAGVTDEFGFIRAVASNTNTRLLNTPEILVQNLKTASIQIGAEVPYSAGIQQNNNDTTVQNIQYRNTGVLLEVTPDIGLDGYISLKIKQELSSIADSSVGGVQSPTFNKSLIETSLTLKDGETFLIGGIITTRTSLVKDGVPFLKDIPFIGRLFKSESSTTRKSELVLLVTVKSLRDKNETHDVLSRYYNSLKALKNISEKSIK